MFARLNIGLNYTEKVILSVHQQQSLFYHLNEDKPEVNQIDEAKESGRRSQGIWSLEGLAKC